VSQDIPDEIVLQSRRDERMRQQERECRARNTETWEVRAGDAVRIWNMREKYKHDRAKLSALRVLHFSSTWPSSKKFVPYKIPPETVTRLAEAAILFGGHGTLPPDLRKA